MNKKIFILHGWTYTTKAWDRLVELLRSAGYEPVQLKVPGLTADSHKPWDLDSYVEWLREELRAEKDVTLIGHSNGGRISIAYAARPDANISRLILIDAAGVVHNEVGLRLKRAVFGALAKAGRPLRSLPLVRTAFYKLIGARDYGAAPAHMRETMAKLIREDLVPIMPRITAPTLIIWGDKDTATPLSDAGIIHAEIKGSKLVVIDGCGHSPHATHPERVSQEVVSWLDARRTC